MGEDSPAVTSHFGSSPVSYALKDSVGNLLFAPYYGTFGSGLWRIDTVLQRINRFAGSSSYDQLGADYVNRLSAEFRGNLVADVGPDGDLWLLESGTAYGRLRRIRKGGQGSLSSASLQMLSTDGVSYWPGEVISATVSEVTDGSGNPLSSVVVQQVPGSSWPGMSTSDLTDIDGISFTTGRAELSPGQYSLQTQILDLDDGVVDAEVLSYEVVRPPSGSLTTWMNGALDSSYSNSDATGLPALTNGRNAIYGMTTTSDGSVYISTYSEPYSVYRITPAGYFELVAGGNGNGYTGDGLAALDAQIQSPTDVAVDEDSNTLYIMCGNSSTTHHIRTVDLTTGIIDTFDEPTLPAGYNYVYNLQVQDSVMYLMTYSMGIVAIDTTASTPTAVQWLPEGNCSSDVLALNYCPDDGCNLAFRADGKVYVSGYFCGTSVTGNQNMIVVAASDGTLESIVVGGGNTLTELPYLGTSTPMVTTEGMAIDSSGNLYYTERSRHWLRKLTPAGMVSTVAGHVDQSLGAEDFRAGVGAGFYNPEHVAVLPDDSVLIHDASHYALRRFWP
jgi:hypothetical protein